MSSGSRWRSRDVSRIGRDASSVTVVIRWLNGRFDVCFHSGRCGHGYLLKHIGLGVHFHTVRWLPNDMCCIKILVTRHSNWAVIVSLITKNAFNHWLGRDQLLFCLLTKTSSTSRDHRFVAERRSLIEIVKLLHNFFKIHFLQLNAFLFKFPCASWHI